MAAETVPATPRTTAGSQRCFSRSTTRATLQRASTKSGEKRPVTDMPKYANALHMRTSASMKFGVATPM